MHMLKWINHFLLAFRSSSLFMISSINVFFSFLTLYVFSSFMKCLYKNFKELAFISWTDFVLFWFWLLILASMFFIISSFKFLLCMSIRISFIILAPVSKTVLSHYIFIISSISCFLFSSDPICHVI